MKKIISIVFLLLIFVQLTSFVFALSPLEKPILESDFRDSEPNDIVSLVKIGETLMILSFFFSLFIGFLCSYFMIKKSPRIPNLIIYEIIFLGSLIWLVSMIVGFSLQYSGLGNIVDSDFLILRWPSIPLLILSSFFLWGLLKKENFAQKMKYTLNLSSGSLIAFFLAILFWIIIGFAFKVDGFIIGMQTLFYVIVGTIISLLLATIGLSIDQRRRRIHS